jgi:galactokinase
VTRAFWAPGRVNLIGEHTDYAGGLVLPAAIDLGVRLEGRAERTIRVESAAFAGIVEIGARGGPATGWGRIAAAVACELDALGRPPVGFHGRLTSTLPAGAGLSSSAAVSVALVLALCAVADFELEPLQAAEAAQRAEQRASGVPCGMMDQAASIFGRPQCALLLDTSDRSFRHVPIPDDLTLVVIDSGTRHELADSAYAQRRRELEAALAGATDPMSLRRIRHLRTENQRVRDVVRCLESGDDVGLGKLFRSGHASLRDDFEVSTPELDAIVAAAYAQGAVAARMTGGGFGGSVVALVDRTDADAFALRVAAAAPCAGAFVTAPSAGAHEL